MATKKPKSGPTDEELLAQFDDLGTESKENKAKPPSTKPSTAAKSSHASTRSQEEADLLAELDTLAQERPKSRPHTPRNVPSSAASIRTSADTGNGPRDSEDKPQTRESAESTRTYHQAETLVDNVATDSGRQVQDGGQQAQPQVSGGDSTAGGGWWGGIVATASAAVKQAEALAKDLRENEDAQKWADQVRGNVGALRSYGKITRPEMED